MQSAIAERPRRDRWAGFPARFQVCLEDEKPSPKRGSRRAQATRAARGRLSVSLRARVAPARFYALRRRRLMRSSAAFA
jgi:hypothetical protein